MVRGQIHKKTVSFADNIMNYCDMVGQKRSVDDICFSLHKPSPTSIACSPAAVPATKRSRSCSDSDTSTIDRLCDQFDWDPNANSLMNLAMLSGQVLELELQQSSPATTPRNYDPVTTFRQELKFALPYTFADLKLSNSGMPLTLSPIAVTTFDANFS